MCIARAQGWVHVRTNGDHFVFRKDGERLNLSIPDHATRREGTLRDLLKVMDFLWTTSSAPRGSRPIGAGYRWAYDLRVVLKVELEGLPDRREGFRAGAAERRNLNGQRPRDPKVVFAVDHDLNFSVHRLIIPGSA
jgi:predicted RNA binding protein YcfA (HicA-like mRNA interferase family)